ncbi:unnamed protein product [Owenia fusiformis]|uniref:Uncharacterized protein n=1 Tax=Owenia fusiformis TaxID=6347 RepID=A0A8J1U1N5_OWEFU|nr:unnamed protein product [Owenia fusiformis]
MNQTPSKKSKMKRKGNDFRPNPSFSKESASPRSPYVGDPRLVPRIQQYLDNRPDNQVINVVTMAGELQDKYPAYARKKRIAFVKQVEKAYNIICAEGDLEDTIEDSSCSLEEKHLAKRRKQIDEGPDNDDSDTSASFSDNAEYVTYKDTNSVNSLLTNLYNKNTPGSRPSTPGSKPNSRPRSPVSQPESRSPISFPGQSETLRNKTKLNDKIKGEKLSNGKRKSFIGQKNVETPEAKEEDDIIEMWTIDRNGDIQDQSTSQKPTPKGLKNPTKQLPGGSNNKSDKGSKAGLNTKAGPSSKTGSSSIITTDLFNVTSSQVLSNTPTICSTNIANILDEKVLAQQLMPHIQYITPETATLKTTEYLRKSMNSSQDQLLKNPDISNIIDIADSAPSTPKSSVDDGVDISAETPLRKNDKEAYVSLKTPKSVKKKKKTGEREKETEKKGVAVQQSQVKFADIGGNDSTLKEICKLLVHMKHPEVYRQLGVTPPRGFLLHGPPGCGKTLLAHAVAGELEMPFLKLASTEIVSGVSGESEEKIRDLFEKARASAPCVLFIDEIDAITQKRETASKDMERRIVSQLLTCMDDLNSAVNAPVLVIGATNRADSLDPALRRAGRFDREISLGIPNEAARKSILEVLCRGLRLADDVDNEQLARDTPGFVGADLQSLAREAAMSAVNRIFNEIENKQKRQACNNITLDETQTECDLIVIDNDVNAIDVDSTDVVIAEVEIEDVDDITEVSKKDEICSPKETVNDCRATISNCKETESNCKETVSNCKETESNCKETVSDCKEKESDCKETERDCKEKESDCKEIESICKETVNNCKETESDCKETESNCKETERNSKEIGSDGQNIPNDTKNLSEQTETNVLSDETSPQECNVSELKLDSNSINDNGQSAKGDDKNNSGEVNKTEDTKENGNSKNCTLAANSSPKQQLKDCNNQSDGVSHNASNGNENEKQTDVEIINIDGSNLDNSIEEIKIKGEKTNTKSIEKQSEIIGNETTSRSEISMEVDDSDSITAVKKMDPISSQSKEPESGEIEILLETIEADADDSSKESDEDDIADVTEPTEKEQLNSVLSWLRDSPPLSVEQLENLAITKQDFKDALKVVQPSAKREGFATIPDVTWDDIGALKEVREELQMAILAPVRHPEQFRSLGLTNPPGILLAGPPGCGKTLLAKAIANESGINFISVKGPELLNMYVGESERAVRQVFQRARNSCPCVIFFDELDALCPKRSHGGEGGSSVRVVNQLLTEMDGLEERKQVYIMAATNRPDIIDPAIMRPGRLDKLLFVGMPTVEDRIDILNAITKNGTKPKFQNNVCLKEIAGHEQCGHYTGADLAALVREASVVALKEFIASEAGLTKSPVRVGKQHFEVAFHKVKPSVSQKDKAMYDRLKMRSATD